MKGFCIQRTYILMGRDRCQTERQCVSRQINAAEKIELSKGGGAGGRRAVSGFPKRGKGASVPQTYPSSASWDKGQVSVALGQA